MESMKQKFFCAAVPLVMLAVSAALSVFVYRLPQPVREPLPVLMYHHMVPDGQDCNDMTVTPGKFRSDLETVLAMGSGVIMAFVGVLFARGALELMGFYSKRFFFA